MLGNSTWLRAYNGEQNQKSWTRIRIKLLELCPLWVTNAFYIDDVHDNVVAILNYKYMMMTAFANNAIHIIHPIFLTTTFLQSFNGFYFYFIFHKKSELAP